MPQVLSKFERPLNPPASSAKGEVKEKRRIPCKWNKFKRIKKQIKFSLLELQSAPEDEDWEKEIEEISCRMEKEKDTKYQTPYDPEYELSVAVSEMILYSVPRAPSPTRDHYIPSALHAPPVKWVCHAHSCVSGQFTDAEE